MAQYCIKISMIQVNFGKVWPSLILVRTDTIFSSFGTRVFLEVLVPKLEKVVTVRTKFRLGHSFSKLAWIREIFTQRHGNAFLLEWSFLLKFKISPNLVLKILKYQSKFGHRNRVGQTKGLFKIHVEFRGGGSAKFPQTSTREEGGGVGYFHVEFVFLFSARVFYSVFPEEVFFCQKWFCDYKCVLFEKADREFY